MNNILSAVRLGEKWKISLVVCTFVWVYLQFCYKRFTIVKTCKLQNYHSLLYKRFLITSGLEPRKQKHQAHASLRSKLLEPGQSFLLTCPKILLYCLNRHVANPCNTVLSFSFLLPLSCVDALPHSLILAIFIFFLFSFIPCSCVAV